VIFEYSFVKERRVNNDKETKDEVVVCSSIWW